MVLYLRRATQADIDRVVSGAQEAGDFVFDEDADEDDIVEFDKAWHAMHFVLTGTSLSSDAVLSILIRGDPIDGADGMGAWIAPVEAMKAFDEAMSALSDEDLAARYDPAAMTAENVYLSDFFEEEGFAGWDYIQQGLRRLRPFAARCADSRTGAISSIG